MIKQRRRGKTGCVERKKKRDDKAVNKIVVRKAEVKVMCNGRRDRKGLTEVDFKHTECEDV